MTSKIFTEYELSDKKKKASFQLRGKNYVAEKIDRKIVKFTGDKEKIIKIASTDAKVQIVPKLFDDPYLLKFHDSLTIFPKKTLYVFCQLPIRTQINLVSGGSSAVLYEEKEYQEKSGWDGPVSNGMLCNLVKTQPFISEPKEAKELHALVKITITNQFTEPISIGRVILESVRMKVRVKDSKVVAGDVRVIVIGKREARTYYQKGKIKNIKDFKKMAIGLSDLSVGTVYGF
ncbi:DUF432 domain-containing protein [Candidatus Undinarchaeota archaeon]